WSSERSTPDPPSGEASARTPAPVESSTAAWVAATTARAANRVPVLVRRAKLDDNMTEPSTNLDTDRPGRGPELHDDELNYDGEQLDLADRISLRRVAGMST
ncbi:hypothetical protein CVB85_25605, partial [Salmonella enterica subsp. enterica serovar Kentucky]